MANFPTLKSGAVAQYGSEQARYFSTFIGRFVDGSEQRFAQYGPAIRQWEIRLDYLDEEEVIQIERFFSDMAGSAGEFEFEDPWDGVLYPSCSFVGDSFGALYGAEHRGQTTIRIRENRV